jgi:hypothetical protein
LTEVSGGADAVTVTGVSVVGSATTSAFVPIVSEKNRGYIKILQKLVML